MSDTILRAGIVGGGIGRLHAPGYRKNPGSELVAFCDIDTARVAAFGDEFGIPLEGRYTDYRQMLAAAKLDVVSICLPNYLHAEVTTAALESGAHVICEKPMATHVADAQRMIAAAESANRRLIVCYNYRYRADTQWMKRVIDAGTLGDVHHVNASWRRETGIPGRGWFGSKALSGGGALIDLGVHALDLTMWLMGFPKVQTVSGETHTLFGQHGLKTWGRAPGAVIDPPFDVDDNAVGFIRFGNGANAVLQATWAEHRTPGDDMLRIEVQGTRGTVILTIPNYRHDDTLRLYTEIEGEPVTITPSLRAPGTSQGHERLISDSIDAIRAGTLAPSDGAQGLAAVRVLEAMYQSAAARKEISLD